MATEKQKAGGPKVSGALYNLRNAIGAAHIYTHRLQHMILLAVPLSTIHLSLFPCSGGAAAMCPGPFPSVLPLVTAVSVPKAFRVSRDLGSCPTPHPSSTRLAFSSSSNVPYFPRSPRRQPSAEKAFKAENLQIKTLPLTMELKT